MVRPPCSSEKLNKKGPWTPEEDIILVSYIQEHGPGNWRSVPTKTGLMRCSKSCRLRWTNYLRPGIKRGNFTDDEEKMIIHLQALLGNRWAAIASYLPQRTDNDIKNYWNTHLRKKLRKIQIENGNENPYGSETKERHSNISQEKGQWERRLQTDIHTAKQALQDALSLSLDNKPTTQILQETNSTTQSSTYVSSAENIARLLENWMKKPTNEMANSFNSSSEGAQSSAAMCVNSLSSINYGVGLFQEEETKPKFETATQVPLTLLEKWLFDEDLLNMSLQESTAGLF